MSARSPSKDSIFVLQAYQIDIAEIQEIGGLPVRCEVVFGQLEPHSSGVGKTFLGIVNR